MLFSLRLRPGRRFLLGVFFSLIVSAALRAQTPVINPTHVTFTASTDHDRTTGTPPVAVLDRYQLTIRSGSASGPVILTRSLGKPTPSPTREVLVAVPEFQTPPEGAYVVVVESVGPGGTTPTPAVPFLVIAPPTAPTALGVRRLP